MQDKRTQILEAALKLFSEKGFRMTSMQDIADAAGIAKGSTYMHFKSKGDLLVSAYQHLYGKYREEFERMAEELAADPRLLLKESVKHQLEIISRHGSLILTQMNEQAGIDNEELQSLFKKIHHESLKWSQERILSVYGSGAKAYAYDGAMLFQSLMKEYFAFMLVFGGELNGDRLAELILGILDSVMEGFRQNKLFPVLDAEGVEKVFGFGATRLKRTPKLAFLQEIRQLSLIIEQVLPDPGGKEELLASLAVMEEEAAKDTPRLPLIRGMLAYVTDMAVPELQEGMKGLRQACADWIKGNEDEQSN